MRIIRTLLPTLILAALPLCAVPTATATSCANVEVIFARGTDQPPGVGDVGQRFIDALSRKVGHVSAYAVNYPATKDFAASTLAGVADAGRHIQQTITACPGTRIVLGGYSQGAAVAGFVTSSTIPDGVDTDLQPMNPAVADHVAAVVLFGTPSDSFLGMIGVPPLVIGAPYAGKTDELCNAGDPICANGSNWSAHVEYDDPQAEEGATFAAWHL